MAATTRQETQCCLTAVKSDVLDSKNVSEMAIYDVKCHKFQEL